jgi:hypothetical protein
MQTLHFRAARTTKICTKPTISRQPLHIKQSPGPRTGLLQGTLVELLVAGVYTHMAIVKGMHSHTPSHLGNLSNTVDIKSLRELEFIECWQRVRLVH